MRKTAAPLLCFGAFCLPFCAAAADWPQAAANPARTAHVDDEPQGPFEIAWVKGWPGEVIFNTCQPIVVDGRVFVGSQNGIVHAVDLATGNDLWQADIGAPIVHTLASDGRRVFAAALDGAVRALDCASGEIAWEKKLSRRGFSAAPLLMDGALYIGCRDGVFYALAADAGELLWQRDTGAPIAQTAAGAQGRVVCVNFAMRAFCLDARSGKVLWTAQLPGGLVRDYWPVIYRGRVIIRVHPAGPKALGGGVPPLQQKFFWPVAYGPVPNQKVLFKARTVDDIIAEQDIVAEFYKTHRPLRTCVVLNLADGSEPYVTSLTAACVNGGVAPPPALAGDGNLYVTFRTSAAARGFVDITRCAVGRFDIDTGKIAKPILCGGAEGVDKVVGVRSPFEVTSDETTTLSSGGMVLFGMRCDETPGAIHVLTRKTFRIPNVALPRASDMQPSGNIIVISGKYVLFTKQSHIVCAKGR